MDLFDFAQQKQQKTPKEEADEVRKEEALDSPIYTVGEITSEVRQLLASRFGRENFWVKGEVSNFRGRNQSGHMYFRLKDDRAVLNCVFFRNVNQRSKVELNYLVS